MLKYIKWYKMESESRWTPHTCFSRAKRTSNSTPSNHCCCYSLLITTVTSSQELTRHGVGHGGHLGEGV